MPAREGAPRPQETTAQTHSTRTPPPPKPTCTTSSTSTHSGSSFSIVASSPSAASLSCTTRRSWRAGLVEAVRELAGLERRPPGCDAGTGRRSGGRGGLRGGVECPGLSDASIGSRRPAARRTGAPNAETPINHGGDLPRGRARHPPFAHQRLNDAPPRIYRSTKPQGGSPSDRKQRDTFPPDLTTSGQTPADSALDSGPHSLSALTAMEVRVRSADPWPPPRGHVRAGEGQAGLSSAGANERPDNF